MHNNILAFPRSSFLPLDVVAGLIYLGGTYNTRVITGRGGMIYERVKECTVWETYTRPRLDFNSITSAEAIRKQSCHVSLGGALRIGRDF